MPTLLGELDATLRAMVQVQRLTGMRPQEVCLLTPKQIDRTGEIWLYRPARPAPKKLDTDERKAWEKAHRWAPNQLRHAAGTEIRAKYGLEAAQVILGHSKASTTEIYAERDLRLAVQVAR